MSEEPRLRVERNSRVATLTLTGRRGTNAMDMAFVQELCEQAKRLHGLADQGVDLAVVRAEGRHFCVGGDLEAFSGATEVGDLIRSMAGFAHEGIRLLHELEIPVVVVVQGAVAGAGMGLVLAGDLVLSQASSHYTAGYAAAGLTPDAGVSWGLPRQVGVGRALELLLTNRRVPAWELVELGLVTRSVPDDQLVTEADAIVDQLLRVSGPVLREHKRLLRRAVRVELPEHLDDEAATISELAVRAYPGS